ncbi:hypothetical protein [Paraburkholderia adhaesiva]|uniref:hypothetical protein n=1 Tax=Paraburkholderia adhaesiva TaxID=2883244 RepID=UPI001F3E49BC|nr:hypothetical protein [Paraburkholderia adhaesiva]
MFPTGDTETRGEWLFRHMLTLYGSRFLAMWRDVDSEDLKRSWTFRLSGLSPEALRVGIEALAGVTHPPMLPEFLELCRTARIQDAGMTPPHLRLPLPRATPEVVDANVKRIHEVIDSIRNRKPSAQWAFDMMLRGCARNGVPLPHETRRISIDAMVSPAGRSFYANSPPELRATYRAVFDAALHTRGEALPSREPGEDDEPLNEPESSHDCV